MKKLLAITGLALSICSVSFASKQPCNLLKNQMLRGDVSSIYKPQTVASASMSESAPVRRQK